MRTKRLPLHMLPPRAKRVILTFTEAIVITESAASAGVFRTLRLNSIYDADTSLGTTTIPGFNEWAAFFSNYRVHSARIHLSAIATGVASSTMAEVTVVPRASFNVMPASAVVWPAMPYATSKSIALYTAGGHNMITIDRQYRIPKILGITRAQYVNEANYSADTSSNPAFPVYCMVCIRGVNSASVATLTGTVRLSFEVEFFNPVLLGS